MFQRPHRGRFAWLAIVVGLLFSTTAFSKPVEDPQSPDATDPKAVAEATTAKAIEDLTAELEKVKKSLEDQRKDFLSGLGAPDKVSQVVTCSYEEASVATDGSQPSLKCDKSLLVGGGNISSIHVSGVPQNNKLTVSIAAADFWGSKKFGGMKASATCKQPTLPLSADSLTFLDGRDSALIQVHMDRYFRPTYGGMASNTTHACDNLRGENPDKRESLSIVLSAAPVLALVEVQFEDSSGDVHTATGPVFLIYQRWAVETGGFFALTNSGDKTLKTTLNKDGTVHVDRVEDSHGLNQQSGVMLSVIPRNYEFLGLGIGLATNSDRAQDIYLGINLRAVSFGGSGLASIFLGAVNRNVLNFRNVEGHDFDADSASLKGTVESKIGYAIGFSFGFKFGGVEATSDATATK